MISEDLRINLSKIHGRETFLGRVSGFGTVKGKETKTICIENIRLENSGEEITSHVWFVCGNAFDKPSIKKGSEISFRAKVVMYVKGVYQERFDYTLNFPSHVQVVGEK